MTIEFADLLGQYMHRADCSAGRLSRLSNVPLRTVENWINGRVRKPRGWQGVVQVAASLHLSTADCSRLLQAAAQPSLDELRKTAPTPARGQAVSPQDQNLLQRWSLPADSAPFQAIAKLPYFVGRAAEIAAMEQTVLQHKHVVIHNLQGMGGIGKTSLAAHLAYQLRPHFPDGILWACVDASSGMSILTSFAAAYGQDVSQHTDLESRARAVGSILAHKKALIVLDNVQNDEQIRPLLPPDGRCAVILTSRKHDLATAMGMQQIQLHPFSDQEALALFTQILGATRVRREREELIALAQLLGHLPLALSIAAGRLAYDEEQTAVILLTQLQKNLHLDELTYGDLSVKASFNISYDMLPLREQQFFAALGIFDGDDFSIEAAAAIADITAAQAQSTLQTLHKLSLVQSARPERYTLHPLLRTFAHENMQDDVVYQRFAAFFAAYTVQHRHTLDKLDLELGNIFSALHIAANLPDKSDLITGATALFELLLVRGMYSEAVEYLTQAEQAARQAKNNSKIARIIRNLGTIAHRRGQREQASQLFNEAMLIARQSEDKELLALTLISFGGTMYDRGQYDLTEEYWLEALNLMRELGNERQMSAALVNLGSVANRVGQFQRAQQYWTEALTLAQKIDHPIAESVVLTNLASIDADRGYLKQAEAYAQRALQIAKKIRRQRGICKLYNQLADIAVSKKAYVTAKQQAQEALQIAREIDEPIMLRQILANYGRVNAYLGEYEQATVFLQESLHIAQNLDHSNGICIAWCYTGILAKLRRNYVEADRALQKSLKLARQAKNLFIVNENLQEIGDLYLRQGNLDTAFTSFQESLSTAQAYKFYPFEGLALFGLAQITLQRGDAAQAQVHGEAALAVFTKIDHVDTSDVRQWLGSLELA